MRTGNLSVDCADRIGVVSEVDGQEGAFTKVPGSVEGPKRRLQGVDNVARSSDFRGISMLERPVGDSGDLPGQRATLPMAFDRAVGCGEERLFVDPVQRAKQQAGEVAAGIDRSGISPSVPALDKPVPLYRRLLSLFLHSNDQSLLSGNRGGRLVLPISPQ